MIPIELFILYTSESTLGLGTGHRAYLYLDETAAAVMGEKLKAAKPPEVTSFDYTVLPLEGAPQP
jgi:hypothetical protein